MLRLTLGNFGGVFPLNDVAIMCFSLVLAIFKLWNLYDFFSILFPFAGQRQIAIIKF